MAKQPILKELEYFVNGATTAATISPSGLSHLVHCGLNLLHNLPASKDAVFEYFTIFFDASVAGYVKLMEVCEPINRHFPLNCFLLLSLMILSKFTFKEKLFINLFFVIRSKRIQIWSLRMTAQLLKFKMCSKRYSMMGNMLGFRIFLHGALKHLECYQKSTNDQIAEVRKKKCHQPHDTSILYPVEYLKAKHKSQKSELNSCLCGCNWCSKL